MLDLRDNTSYLTLCRSRNGQTKDAFNRRGGVTNGVRQRYDETHRGATRPVLLQGTLRIPTYIFYMNYLR